MHCPVNREVRSDRGRPSPAVRHSPQHGIVVRRIGSCKDIHYIPETSSKRRAPGSQRSRSRSTRASRHPRIREFESVRAGVGGRTPGVGPGLRSRRFRTENPDPDGERAEVAGRERVTRGARNLSAGAGAFTCAASCSAACEVGSPGATLLRTTRRRASSLDEPEAHKAGRGKTSACRGWSSVGNHGSSGTCDANAGRLRGLVARDLAGGMSRTCRDSGTFQGLWSLAERVSSRPLSHLPGFTRPA